MTTVCGRCGSHEQRPTVGCAACFPWSRVLTCCHLAPVGDGKLVVVSCGRDAEYELVDLGGNNYDPATDTTYACEEHVGAMLSHAVDLPEDAPDEWRVRALDPSEVGTLEAAAV